MKLKKHALHLAVAAGMVGSMVAVAAPAAHAAGPTLPDICGTYLQGTIDPAGGPLPGGIIPLNPPTTSQTYGVFGHLAKGQDKEIVNVHQGGVVGTKEVKTTIGVTWGGGQNVGQPAPNGPNAPYLAAANGGTEPTGGTTSAKIAWTTDAKTGIVALPTVQVAEASKVATLKKGSITKGVVTGTPSGDDAGVQIGNLQQGNSVVPLNTIDQVVVPNDATTSDHYQLTMAFPNIPTAGPLAGVTLQSNPIAVNATAATVATAINSGPGWGGIVGPTATVTNVTPLPAVAAGDFKIVFAGALTGQALPLLGTTVGTTETQSAALKATVLDDGAIWNSGTAGGINPSKSPISDLGNGIITSTGVMSAGPVGGVAGTTSSTVGGELISGSNPGKANFIQDTQYTYIQYPSAIVSAIAPNLTSPTNTAVPVLAAITGLPASSVGENCGLGGLLAIFCVEDAAVIPSTFAGLCGAITS